jgi:hypothetical protein
MTTRTRIVAVGLLMAVGGCATAVPEPRTPVELKKVGEPAPVLMREPPAPPLPKEGDDRAALLPRCYAAYDATRTRLRHLQAYVRTVRE